MIRLFGRSRIIGGDETLDVHRTGSTVYPHSGSGAGKPLKYDDLVFKLVCNVQPVNGHDLLMVPEHDRFRELYWLYFDNKQFVVDHDMQVKGPAGLQLNDRVVRLGANYQVQQVQNWGTYSRAMVSRIDVGPQTTPETTP